MNDNVSKPKTLVLQSVGRQSLNAGPAISAQGSDSPLQGCLIERMQGFSYAVKDLEGVVAEVVTVGIQMNKRTHTLILMFYLMEENVDVSTLPQNPPPPE